MARIDWIETRLENWARWKLAGGTGALGYASVDLTRLADADAGRSGYITSAIPINDVEASATDDAVERLPGELRATVREYYLGQGGESEHCRRLVCARSTLHARIERAHRLLADHFLAQQERERVERARVEQLQATARPGSFTG